MTDMADMADRLTILIDVTGAEVGVEPAELEARGLALADELESGGLANTARLVRETDLPDRAMSGALAFIGGVLMTEINRENLKKAMDFLGVRFYGKTLTLEYEADGLKTAIEYRNQQELDQALAAVKTLESMRIRVK